MITLVEFINEYQSYRRDAAEHSEAAHHLSSTAKTKEEHSKAASAHNYAALTHEEAMEKAHTKRDREFHHNMAAHHDRLVDHHSKEAGE